MIDDEKSEDADEGAGEGRNSDGTFAPSNELWKQRKRSGRRLAIESGEELEQLCFDYFEWVDANPLWEVKGFGTGLMLRIPKKRYPTINGLALHIGIGMSTMHGYQAQDHEYSEIIAWARECIDAMKMEGAAAGFFNQLIAARDMGLKEKREVDGNMIVNVIDTFAGDE